MHVIGKLAGNKRLDGWMDGWISIHPSAKLPCKRGGDNIPFAANFECR